MTATLDLERTDMAKKKGPDEGIPVAKRALLARINRHLATKGQKLFAARSERIRAVVGDFYLIDTDKNLHIDDHIDLEEFGRELGVLQPWEKLEEESEE